MFILRTASVHRTLTCRSSARAARRGVGRRLPVVRDQYHDELDAITASLVDITRLAGSAINRATTALLDADLQEAETVISGDAAIDQLYADIEARALDLLARQQPVASDL